MQYDVIIAGGGMVGLTQTIALAREGLRVAVLERTPLPAQLEPAFDGRVSAVALASQRLLSAVGAWEGMEPHAQPILDIRVSDGDSPFFLHYDHHEVGSEPFGWIVENRHIRHALIEAARALPTLEVIIDEVRHIEAQGSTVTVNGALAASLLIGADGKQSRVRELAGISCLEASYKQSAIVCTIAHAQPHGGLAQERFLPAGPFAVLPMTGNRSSLVWTEKTENIPLFLRLPEEEFVQEIRERVGDYLGEIRTEGPRFSYPLSLAHAQSYTAPRLALIGDAAHGIHPIAGQGVNLGWRDVAALAELITERAKLGLDIGAEDVLAAYARRRRFDNCSMLAVTDGLNRLFSNNLWPLKLARGLGLWGVSHLPPLKRFFMRDAMGLAGDVPKLMRKKAA